MRAMRSTFDMKLYGLRKTTKTKKSKNLYQGSDFINLKYAVSTTSFKPLNIIKYHKNLEVNSDQINNTYAISLTVQ